MYRPDELPTIPRATLMAVTEHAIVSTLDALPDELVEEAREVAETAKYICPEWSSDEPVAGYGACGCLIGTMQIRRGEQPVCPDDRAKDSLGMAFFNGLTAVDYRFFEHAFKPIRVID